MKVPRIPVDDNSGDPDPRFLDLYEHIKARLPKRPKAGGGVLAREDRLLAEVESALTTLASAWQGEFERWRSEDRLVSPATIVVCDQTATAERVADFIGRGSVIPELANRVGANPIAPCALISALPGQGRGAGRGGPDERAGGGRSVDGCGWPPLASPARLALTCAAWCL